MAFSEFELTFMARLSALTVVVEFAGNSYVPPWEVVTLHIGVRRMCKTTPQGRI